MLEAEPHGHLTWHNKPFNQTLHSALAKTGVNNERRVSSVKEVKGRDVEIATPEVALQSTEQHFDKGQFFLFQ